MAATPGGWPRRIGRVVLSWLLVSALLGAGVAFYGVVIEPNRIVVEQATCQLPPRGGTLREGSYKVAFVSDLDLSAPPGRFARRAQDVVNGLHPDLIAFGGDLIGGAGAQPSNDFLDAVGRWLAGFRARDGMVLVWGEQEQLWPEAIREHLPPGVRDLQQGAEIHAAGEARIRFCGPDGLYPPLWIDPSAGGRLLAGWGRSLVVARYHVPGAEHWTNVDVLARVSCGAIGDGPGLAVLESPGRPGFRLRVLPDALAWGLLARDGGSWVGRSRDATVFVHPGQDYFVRIHAAPGPRATELRSRIWRAGEPEPKTWPIEVVDDSPQRPREGAVAIVAGGAWTGSFHQAWESIEVRDGAGQLLLKDEFDDPAAFAARWENPGGRMGDFDATVVIAHNPRFLLDAPRRYDLLMNVVLAGHSHGGQVRLPLFGPLHLDPELPRSWAAGWTPLHWGSIWLYATRGLGTTYVPMRLGCPPEVTDMQLQIRLRPPH